VIADAWSEVGLAPRRSFARRRFHWLALIHTPPAAATCGRKDPLIMANTHKKSAKSSSSKASPKFAVVVRLALTGSSRAVVHISTPDSIALDSDRSFKAGKDL
jgi:hypothetical protein